MIVEVILISVIVALIRKGKISNITKYDVKLKVLFFAYLIVQLGLVFLGNQLPQSIANYTMFIYLLSYLLLLGFLLRNIERPEMMILLLGVFLNFTVTFVNGGKMPLSLDAAAMSGLAENGNAFLQKFSAISMAMGASTKLKILADIIPMPAFYPFSTVISVGDLIIFVGLFIAVQKAFVRAEDKENLFSTKKEREREEQFFSKDVNLVDISEFFGPEEPRKQSVETTNESETNAITKLIEEISEVKEPEPAAQTMAFQTNAAERKAPDMAPKHTAAAEPSAEVRKEPERTEKAVQHTPKSETSDVVKKEGAAVGPTVLEVKEETAKIEETAEEETKPAQTAQETPIVFEEPEKTALVGGSFETEAGEVVEVEPGQLTFLDEEMAMYIDLFKTNSPLKDYIKNMAEQSANTPQQEEETADETDASSESLGLDGTENIMRKCYSQQHPEEAVKAPAADNANEPVDEATFDKEIAASIENTASLSATRQLSMQDLAKTGEEDRLTAEADDLEHPVITRQINARPSTRAILRALKDGEGFEYNEDKYTLAFKESEDVPLQERKEMFLQQLYEYDIDIRKTNAATNEEKEKIEMDIKRDQGINVDDMFIVQDGKFIENPNYKFKKKK